MNSQISTLATIEEFARLVVDGINAWTSAGKILNELIKEDETVRDRIMDKIPWMTPQVLDGFERIGREEIFPHLLLDRSPGAHALIALPYEEQKRLHAASMAIAVYKKGEITTEHRRLQELTEREADLVFTDTAVRPIAEQSKILLAKIRGRGTSNCSPRAPDVEQRSERQIVEPLDDDPDETVEANLADAQAKLIRAREIMARKGKLAILDRFITTALNAIGNLRFELKE